MEVQIRWFERFRAEGIKELEAENAKLKRLYAELALENHALKDVIEKKL